jgi:hypothetical protein
MGRSLGNGISWLSSCSSLRTPLLTMSCGNVRFRNSFSNKESVAQVALHRTPW